MRGALAGLDAASAELSYLLPELGAVPRSADGQQEVPKLGDLTVYLVYVLHQQQTEGKKKKKKYVKKIKNSL